MIGKKINQLATELAPVSTDLTIIGDPTTGVSKKITLAQLGAIFSGAVSFYNDLASFPATGDINVIYCAKDTQKLYLWSGSAYVEVFPSQALLDTYQLRSEKGVSNGYASLDSSGKVPISQLPSSIMEYKGTWNAATNTPTLENGTGDTGDVYICNVAGTVNFGAGPITFAVGDYTIYSGSIWQRSSGAVGTVTSVAASITGNAIGITGSPVTTSGTLAFAFAGTSGQYINGAGNLTTFPTLTGFVPYTGATANVDLGTFDLTADILTAATGSYTSSGGGNTLEISHTSGSGIALNITKGGNGEGLYINKTSGSGNAATIIGTLNATTLVKSGGTSTQFLKADGSVDSNTYLTASSLTGYVPYTGATANVNLGTYDLLSRSVYIEGTASYQAGLLMKQINGFNFVTGAYTQVVPSGIYDLYVVHNQTNGTRRRYAISVASLQDGDDFQYLVPRQSGTFAMTSDIPSLTGYVQGTGTTNYLPKFTGTSTIGDSQVFDNGTNVGIGTASPQQKLDVFGISRISSTTPTQEFFTTVNGDVWATIQAVAGTGSGGSLSIGTKRNGDSVTEKLRILDNGNLGLGTSSPTSYTSRFIEISNSTSAGIKLTGGTSGNSLGSAIEYVASDKTLRLTTYEAGSYIRFNPVDSEKMRLNASGNLSIGNTNDSYKLDVSGTGRFTNSSGETLVLSKPSGPSIQFNKTLATAQGWQLSGEETAFKLYNTTATTTPFQISTSGIATFTVTTNKSVATYNAPSSWTGISDYVTGGVGISFSRPNDGASANAIFTFNGAADNNFAISARSSFIIATGGGLGGSTQALKITDTGAATFSSSVALNAVFNSTTNTPYIRFDETGSAKFFIGQRGAVSGDGGTGYDFYTVAGNDLRFFAGGTKALTLATTGAATFSSSVTAQGPNDGTALFLQRSGGANVLALNTNSNGSWTMFDYASGSYTAGITQKSGSVGIGTTSPSSNLSVRNEGTSGISIIDVRGGVSGAGVVQISGNGTTLGSTSFDLIQNSAGALILQRDNNPLSFYTNNTERMRITSGGNVGIGTSSPSSSVASNVLALYGSYPGLVLESTGVARKWSISANWGGGSAFLSFYDETANTERMRISSGGLIYMNNLGGYSGSFSDVRYDTSSKELFYQTSSRRYKDNIVNLENTLSKVNQLRAVRFIDKHTQRENCGFIAEEVIEIIPDVVFKKEINGKLEVEGINYSDFAPFIIKALQEQQAEIEALKLELKNK